MSKKIHTIQSSDKEKFEKEVNFFLELGSELLEGGYEVIKKEDDFVYSQVIVFNNCDTEFYKNGKLKKYQARNAKGEKHGKWFSWFENGQQKSEEYFSLGKHINESFKWKKNGILKRKQNYITGENDIFENFLETKYNDKGKLLSEIGYYREKVNGEKIREGRTRIWFNNGRIKEEEFFSKGERYHGTYKAWYVTGKMERLIDFKDGYRDGLFMLWHKDGKIKEETRYKRDKRVGKSIENYQLSGDNVIIESEYNDGGNLISRLRYRNQIKVSYAIYKTWKELGVSIFSDIDYTAAVKDEEWYYSGKKKSITKIKNLDDLKYIQSSGRWVHNQWRALYIFEDRNIWEITFWDKNENKYIGIFREWSEGGWQLEYYKSGKYIIYNGDFSKKHPQIPLKNKGYCYGEIKDGKTIGDWIFFDSSGNITERKTY